MRNGNGEDLFRDLADMIGEDILIITESTQLNILGQTFRPIFCGTIAEVEVGHITLDPITIKMVNAPFFQFPLPLSIPIEKIVALTSDFDCDTVFPLT
ncbi:hypothetical protein ACLM5H_01215 [Fredinandcohnia humi]